MTAALLRVLVTLALVVLTITACMSVVPDPETGGDPAAITTTLEG